MQFCNIFVVCYHILGFKLRLVFSRVLKILKMGLLTALLAVL